MSMSLSAKTHLKIDDQNNVINGYTKVLTPDYRPGYLNSADLPWVERVLSIFKSCNELSTAEFDHKLAIAEIKWSSHKKGKSLIQYLMKNFTRTPVATKCKSARLQAFEQVFRHPSFPDQEHRTTIVKSITNAYFSDEYGSDFLGDLSGERIICLDENESGTDRRHYE